MREYTKELLIGFKKLCDKPQARTAKARKALGIAIICEAQIGIVNPRNTTRGPWMSEVEASFSEMIDEGWIKQIPVPEDSWDYSEFENPIKKFYGGYTTPKETLTGAYPFGDHWFRLTSIGEKEASALVEKGPKLKAFLSYSHLDKGLASVIKHALEEYGIEAFLAHEDIEPSAEWVETIKDELEACNVFLPILTDNFHKSAWTDQETGIALTHNKLIIPLKVTKDPYGFTSKIQALKIDTTAIELSCRKLMKLILSKPGVGDLVIDDLIRRFEKSHSFDSAAKNTELLISYQNHSLSQVVDIIKYTIANSQINQSWDARKKISEFIHTSKYINDIDPALLQEFDKKLQPQ